MRFTSLAVLCLIGCGEPVGPGGTGGGGGSGGGGEAGCSSATCAGCCLNGACQSGNTASACGKGAATCVACSTNQICRVDQTCGVDPDSMWKVQPTSGSIAANNNGSQWDPDGSAPDPKVYMYCPATASTATSSTPESSDTRSPTWSSGGCSMKARDLMSTGFAFQVIDVDTISDDTITGGLIYKPVESDFVSASVTLGPSGGLTSITIQLQRQ